MATTNVPHTFGITGDQDEIPRNFDAVIGPPFKPIHMREIWDPKPKNREKRLSEHEVREFINNPTVKKSTRLRDMSKGATEERIEKHEREKIYNMSVRGIIGKTNQTIVTIINELLDYNPKSGFEGFMNIFMKEDRLIYIGLVIVIFSFIVLLIRTTDK